MSSFHQKHFSFKNSVFSDRLNEKDIKRPFVIYLLIRTTFSKQRMADMENNTELKLIDLNKNCLRKIFTLLDDNDLVNCFKTHAIFRDAIESILNDRKFEFSLFTVAENYEYLNVLQNFEQLMQVFGPKLKHLTIFFATLFLPFELLHESQSKVNNLIDRCDQLESFSYVDDIRDETSTFLTNISKFSHLKHLMIFTHATHHDDLLTLFRDATDFGGLDALELCMPKFSMFAANWCDFDYEAIKETGNSILDEICKLTNLRKLVLANLSCNPIRMLGQIVKHLRNLTVFKTSCNLYLNRKILFHAILNFVKAAKNLRYLGLEVGTSHDLIHYYEDFYNELVIIRREQKNHSGLTVKIYTDCAELLAVYEENDDSEGETDEDDDNEDYEKGLCFDRDACVTLKVIYETF